MWRNECRVCLLISSSTSSRAGTVDRSENVGPLTRGVFYLATFAVVTKLVAAHRVVGDKAATQGAVVAVVLSQG
jgi:hypothetical protein